MDRRSRERVIRTAAEIEAKRAQLRALEGELKRLEVELDLLMGVLPETDDSSSEKPKLADEIVRLAVANGPAPFSVEEVLTWLQYEPERRSVLLTTLSRMQKAGRVVRVQRGLYQLSIGEQIVGPADEGLTLFDEAGE
jgi:hypothetical protein